MLIKVTGMDGNKVLNEMPADSLVYTGHYIDHELVANIEADCNARIARKQNGKPMRFLLTIGGAGAQKEIFAHIIKYLILRRIRQCYMLMLVIIKMYGTNL